MTKPIIRIHDLATNEIVDREMNHEEFAQYEIDIENAKARKLAIQEREAAKQEILDRLGLTADEAKILLG